MNILLVDDEESVLHVLGDFLTESGHTVHTAGNGIVALARLDELDTVEVILSDVRMPKMDGFEFLRLARLQCPETPMIIMTAHGDEEVAVDVFHDGAFDYIRKPVGLEALANLLEGIAGSRREEDAMLDDYSALLDREQGTPPVEVSACINRLRDQLADIGRVVEKSEDRRAALEISKLLKQAAQQLADLEAGFQTTLTDREKE